MPSESQFAHQFGARTNELTRDAVSNLFGAGLAWLDSMMTLQREWQQASLRSLPTYAPAAASVSMSARPSTNGGAGAPVSQAGVAGIQVLPLGEERLNVAVRTERGETTRLRRRVVAQPVEQQVTLREEKVVVERRLPAAQDGSGDVLTETVVEMSDSRQVPSVWKSLHVAEEVVLRKQVTERTEKVREIVRRDVAEVEHDRVADGVRAEGAPAGALPASLTPTAPEHRPIGATARAEDRRAPGATAEKKPDGPVPAETRG